MYWFADYDSLATFEAEMMASMGNDATNKLMAEGLDLFDGPPQVKIIVTM